MPITSYLYKLYSADISRVGILATVIDYAVDSDTDHCIHDLQEAARMLIRGERVSVAYKEGIDSDINRAVATELNGGTLPTAWSEIDSIQ